MNPRFFVSVIIPTYRDWNRLALCLDALKKQTYPQEQFEVLIVNNDPEDSIPAKFPISQNVKILQESKQGSYAARNTALNFTKGSIIGFTDSDCIPDQDWIKNAVNYLSKNKDFARVAGPVQIIIKGKTPTIVERYNQIYSFPQEWLINNGGGSVTANLFTYKYVFDEVGGFDESLFSMGDKFWGMKAESAGYKIAYTDNVSVLHPPRTLNELIQKEKRHGGAVSNLKHNHPLLLCTNLLYEARPRLSALNFMFGRSKDRRIKDRVTIPFIRHFLKLVRSYESIKVHLGKKPTRT